MEIKSYLKKMSGSLATNEPKLSISTETIQVPTNLEKIIRLYLLWHCLFNHITVAKFERLCRYFNII